MEGQEGRTIIKRNDATSPSQFFNQLDALRIIFPGNFLAPLSNLVYFACRLNSGKPAVSSVLASAQVLDDDDVISAGMVPLLFAREWVGVDVLEVEG